MTRRLLATALAIVAVALVAAADPLRDRWQAAEIRELQQLEVTLRDERKQLTELAVRRTAYARAKVPAAERAERRARYREMIRAERAAIARYDAHAARAVALSAQVRSPWRVVPPPRGD